jgi:hypothetical protein
MQRRRAQAKNGAASVTVASPYIVQRLKVTKWKPSGRARGGEVIKTIIRLHWFGNYSTDGWFRNDAAGVG